MKTRYTTTGFGGFGDLFRAIEKSWFRLETLQTYQGDCRGSDLAAFRKAGAVPNAPGPWQEMMSQHVQAGRTLQRVHIVEEPLTDYLRYELACYQRNAAAGEDIRLIPVQPPAWPGGLPRDQDFWIIDDRDVWDMRYDEDGRFIAAELSDSGAYLEQCRRWRDLALQQSIDLVEYARRTFSP